MPPVIDEALCTVCKTCLDICPLDVFSIDKVANKIIVRYADECWHCRACAIDCPKGAIMMRYPLSHMMLHMPVKEEKKVSIDD